MPYNYEAASSHPAPRAKPSRQATSSSSRAYPASGPSIAMTAEDNTTHTTRDRWSAAQSPTVHMSSGSRPKGVRFAPAVESSSHLQPHSRYHRADSPTSQASYGSYGSSAPSLSHSAEFEDDDFKCPPTPEFKPVPLTPEKSKSTGPVHASFSTIDQILYEVNTCVVAFQPPRDLDFAATLPGSSSAPALAYTAKNRPFLEHNQRLEGLQSELDAVESHGNQNVRKARKEAVAIVERELEGLKRIQARVWSKYVQKHRSQRQ